MSQTTVQPPFPVHDVKGRYLIYDVDIVTYIRREHHICGVLVGTIPHISSQNVFLGLPLELMPEEARILVEHNVAYIVDDVQAHGQAMLGMSTAEAEAFKKVLESQGLEMAKNNESSVNERKRKHLERQRHKHKKPASDSGTTPTESTELKDSADVEGSENLFDPTEHPASDNNNSALKSYAITPATSYPPLDAVLPETQSQLPPVPSSYPLFAHLHSRGFFMNPGLRFGCQYCAYPGDPLRYHSHFLAIGKDCDEEFGLLEIVGGGRLGTSVKKAYLIGGKIDEKNGITDSGEQERARGISTEEGEVRTFCIEWAGM